MRTTALTLALALLALGPASGQEANTGRFEGAERSAASALWTAAQAAPRVQGRGPHLGDEPLSPTTAGALIGAGIGVVGLLVFVRGLDDGIVNFYALTATFVIPPALLGAIIGRAMEEEDGGTRRGPRWRLEREPSTQSVLTVTHFEPCGEVIVRAATGHSDVKGTYEIWHPSLTGLDGCFVVRADSADGLQPDPAVLFNEDLYDHGDPLGSGAITVDLVLPETHAR